MTWSLGALPYLTLLQLLQDHLSEMFSVVYTPTEGEAIQNFSRIFRRPEGCFLNIYDVDRVEEDLSRWGRSEDIDYIVVTGLWSFSSPSKELFPGAWTQLGRGTIIRV